MWGPQNRSTKTAITKELAVDLSTTESVRTNQLISSYICVAPFCRADQYEVICVPNVCRHTNYMKTGFQS